MPLPNAKSLFIDEIHVLQAKLNLYVMSIRKGLVEKRYLCRKEEL